MAIIGLFKLFVQQQGIALCPYSDSTVAFAASMFVRFIFLPACQLPLEKPCDRPTQSICTAVMPISNTGSPWNLVQIRHLLRRYWIYWPVIQSVPDFCLFNQEVSYYTQFEEICNCKPHAPTDEGAVFHLFCFQLHRINIMATNVSTVLNKKCYW